VERYNTAYRAGTAAQSAEFDAGLRSYMLKVYNYMASGVLLTGIVAMVFANMLRADPELVQTVYGSPLRWVLALAPFAFIMVMSFGINKLSSAALQGIFWAFSAVMGLSLASILLVYTGESVARTFFITAASFGALSLYGYTTKKDLSGLGTFLVMGVIGLFIAMVVNIFLASSMMQFVISCAGVLIFAGLTAYDTQRIKENYYLMATGEAVAKGAIMGAVNLYLDFVNLFVFLLQFLGNRE
jgi:FtsH-binding integral membrane protein